MIKALLKYLVLFSFIPITYLIIFLVPVKSDLIYASIVDKHNLLKNTDASKIVFVGGSNLALGLDSELIQKETGRPVINMGLNGGLGLRYMLNEIKPYIRDGDIIVMTPEYEHYYGGLLDGGINLLWIIQIMPESIRYISPNQYLELLKKIPEFMQQRAKEILSFEQDPVYNRRAFNEYGDFVNHLGLQPKENLGGVKRINQEEFNAEAIQVTREFVEFADNKGVVVVYIFPPLAESQYQLEDNSITIAGLYDQLKGISNLNVLSTPEEYVFPNKLFFDTVYHLTREGREARSVSMADQLNLFLADELTQKAH